MARLYRKGIKSGSIVAGVRLSPDERSRLQAMADAQTGGNVSVWLRDVIAASWGRFKRKGRK